MTELPATFAQTVLVAFPGNEFLTRTLAHTLSVVNVALELRQFPDGASLVRLVSR